MTLSPEEKRLDDLYFKCLTCGHDAMFHFHAAGPCQNECDCAEFLSQAMREVRPSLVRALAKTHGQSECEVDWMLADIEAIAGDPRLSHLTVEEMFAHWIAYSESMFAGWMDMGNAGAERLLRWIENGSKDANCILRAD